MDTCTFFDSLCQSFIIEKHNSGHEFSASNTVEKYNEKIIGNSFFNMGDYRKIFENEFNISTNKVNLNCYYRNYYGNPIYILSGEIHQLNGYSLKPFHNWNNTTNNSLEWWNDFTSLKHNRLINVEKGTYENLINALAATFIILSIKNEDTFKNAQLDKEIYNIFFPKYWTFEGISTSRGNLRFT